jgi:hypothetical protein
MDVQNVAMTPPDWDEVRDKMASALAALLRRRNRDAFVIFEEKPSGKFVQFARALRQELLLDLPLQTLDVGEQARAAALFLGLGVQETEDAMLDGPGGRVVGRQRSFQMTFGDDVRAAADVASEVFRRVFQSPPSFELELTEN